ncbi:hypothetical protein B0S90_2211 [Caldicellulosiruptor bescii]|uniref:Uncharacterized protein n=2 Tax=Caldicellulosiruptor bescii TaxID=31899 RepID=B9MKY0_CALBD|nr:hypothetical protein [Caldicellulosiruptor bescii]ACM60988.1 conserved hypothetical protein [Caldicellulosiruptor bescii DSM 6725]PBC89199.1 hypothetical protein B0S87_2279 [Caldicellulosiruptor bescii]PBC91319.1 hypothetical protein B0S89_1713 [Caldicellulosiruptor bescii]PBD03269.1 hypothetical protein B0S85_0855 [Caldicellulosiruptor bescii]PBD07117.1 hypothetical protein B0S90_2211 [Caldicellulosiruptor bescii]
MEKERKCRFKKGVNFLILVLVAGVLSLGVIFASTQSIDSNALVTYGFLKKQVDQLKAYIDNKINELDKKIKDTNTSSDQAQDISKLQSRVANLSSEIEKLKLQTAQLDAQLKNISSSSGVKKGDFIYTKGYEVIKVPKNKTILFDASTEFVVRVGKAISVLPKGATIIDLTSAKDIGANQQLLFNHFYLVARSDGRGLKALDDVWVIVNGGYKIK